MIGLRVVDLQAISGGQLASRGISQRVRTIPLAAARGSIFDRNGYDLALSVERKSVWANPKLVKDPRQSAEKLANVLEVDAAVLENRLRQSDKVFVYLARQIEDSVVKKIKEMKLPGVYFVEESKRYYPGQALAAPVIGFVGIDNDGLGGTEFAFEEQLAGKPGRVVVERDPSGREIPTSARQVEQSERGNDLILTLDAGLQYQAEQMLLDGVVAAGAKGGTLVLSDVRTGEILAMASVDGPTSTSPAQPARAASRNRPVTDVYEPGSTNKVITIAGAIEEKVVGPNTTFDVPDNIQIGEYSFKDSESHPIEKWSTSDIVTKSSNVGTIMIGQQLGKKRMDHYLRAFGFGSKTNLDFPGEASGILLDPKDYTDSSMATVPIGNGLAVTAAQMLEVFMTIANGGASRPLQIVRETVNPSGEREAVPPPPSKQVVLSSTAATVTKMLQRVVTEGTGSLAAVPGYEIAGKTGTARKPPYEKPPYKYVSSFAGFAPANDPRLAAIVVLDEPSTVIYGGAVAAPVFARIMQVALRDLGIAPSKPTAGSLPAPATTTTITTTSAPFQNASANLNSSPSG